MQFIGVKIIRDREIPVHPNILNSNYCPPAKLREGNVFTPMCHSVFRGFPSPLPWMETPTPVDRPPGQRPPWTETPA